MLLREAANEWSLRGPVGIPEDEVLAVMLRALGRRSRPPQGLVHLEQWRSIVSNPEAEVKQHAADGADSQRLAAMLGELRDVLHRAATAWSTSGVAEPSPEIVLRWIADLAFRGGIARLPPPPHLGG
jgi:hypothetical protein